MNLISSFIFKRKPLPLSERQTECVEDGMLWALNCLSDFAPPPVRAWVAQKQSTFESTDDLAPTALATRAEVIWARLGLTASLGHTLNHGPADAALHVSARLIALSEHRPPLWWSGTAKAAQFLALILGLGLVFSPSSGAAPTDKGKEMLLSDAETGYALALIAEYSGVEPRATLSAFDASVREAFLAGQAHLGRNKDLRNDLQALTDDYDRLALRR